ncbi:E set domain-containing protein [Aureobasidium subglaciale]|nr:E set domain-containing protein [Aureobasidium subglaciale]KAI5228422.1 E set domain-containing protein [Aureobasidium subglaciale]KAI5232034.1 E set domain-containing protein [Aureobasidium subglaciale]KAI5265882.1 E set domain-containing protein [Aureobasidium subglaciale]
MNIKFADLDSADNDYFQPRSKSREADDRAQSKSSTAPMTPSSRRSSNRRQPWIDARKLSDEQKQQHIDAEIQRKARRSSVRTALENTIDIFSKPASTRTSSRTASRDEDELAPEFVRAMPGDEAFKPARRTVSNDRRRSLVQGLQSLHKHDSIMGPHDKGVLSRYSGGRDRDSKIPRKESYVRSSIPNALLPSPDDDRRWARQVLRCYSSTMDASHCDVFTWHAVERKDDPVHLIICHGEMVFMDQYGKELPGQPEITHQLEAIHLRGPLRPDYEGYDVPLTRIPTRQVEEQTAEHFRAILECNGSEISSPPTTVQVGWWLHNSPVYRMKYREAELWMTIDGRNMPNRPAISEQIKQIKEMTDDSMRSDDSSSDISPGHIGPHEYLETRVSRQAIEQEDRDLCRQTEGRGKSWTRRFFRWMGARLRKWKESLGIGSGTTIGDASDPRKVIIVSLGLEVEGRPDIIIDLSSQGALESLKSKPFTIKEGATFRMKARFRVQHQILSGMKYVQVVKRMGISNKMQEMIGSYSPNTTDKPEYEKKFEAETAPSGMMARGHYNAVSKFIDDDEQTHLKFEWSFDIKKDW